MGCQLRIQPLHWMTGPGHLLPWKQLLTACLVDDDDDDGDAFILRTFYVVTQIRFTRLDGRLYQIVYERRYQYQMQPS